MEVTLDKWQKWVSALIEGDNSVVTKLNKGACSIVCVSVILFERIDA